MATQGKSIRFATKPAAAAIAVAACFGSAQVLAAPTGPAVVSGQVSMQQVGNLLQVTNSPNSIINWQSFSIGANEITRFLQQSSASAVLNRVTGAGGTIDPSVILGALQSNGRVFLINPSGIVFGSGAQVDVAGLVASSLNLSNADFLAGRMRFTEVPGAGSIANHGNINTGLGGQVYLVGPSVTNSGIITSPRGEVVLAAGNSVELVNPASPNLRVEISAQDNEARNLGLITADAGRVGIYAGLINHSGTIRADSAQVTDDGRIILKATRNVTLEPTSVLSSSGARGGEILVLADDTVRVAGRLDASASTGDGGFIETSGAHVKVDPSTVVTTTAQQGRTGTWLIDPPDYLIAATGGDITGATLGSNLNSTSVVILSSQGTAVPSGNGDIFVNDTVTWSSGNSLTLDALRNVQINSPITNASIGDVFVIARGGNVVSSAPITTGGYAILRATQGAIIDGNGAGPINVTAQYLEAASMHGINLDTNVTTYVNATNGCENATSCGTSGDIVIRNISGSALVQNIHNMGGNNILSGLTADANSTIATGGIVIHFEWNVSGGQSIGSLANPAYTFTTATGGNVIITLNTPRASTYQADPYVYLLDGAGRTGSLLAQDDDSFHGYVSVINPPNPGYQIPGYNMAALAPGGTYTVVAATYSGGMTAPFDLSIGGLAQALPPTPPSLPSSLIPPPPPEVINNIVQDNIDGKADSKTDPGKSLTDSPKGKDKSKPREC